MKIRFSPILAASILLTSLAAIAEDYPTSWKTVIIQANNLGVEMAVSNKDDIGVKGTIPSLPMESGDVTLKLLGFPQYADKVGTPTLVATKTISAIDATITASDPAIIDPATGLPKLYPPVENFVDGFKVRADKPFNVTINTEGLKPATMTGVPDAAKKVRFIHTCEVYEKEEDMVLKDKPVSPIATKVINGGGNGVDITTNGTLNLDYSLSNLLGMTAKGKLVNPFKACGFEKFKIFMYNETTGNADIEVASVKVQITPVPGVVWLRGIEEGKTYENIPDSEWQVEIIGGVTGGVTSQSLFVVAYPKGYPSREVVLQSTPIITNGKTSTLVTTTVERNCWAPIDSQGDWTVEVLIGTDQYSAERIGTPDPIYTFTVDKTIKVNGGIFTGE